MDLTDAELTQVAKDYLEETQGDMKGCKFLIQTLLLKREGISSFDEISSKDEIIDCLLAHDYITVGSVRGFYDL